VSERRGLHNIIVFSSYDSFKGNNTSPLKTSLYGDVQESKPIFYHLKKN
jgi:hypothetical protein